MDVKQYVCTASTLLFGLALRLVFGPLVRLRWRRTGSVWVQSSGQRDTIAIPGGAQRER